MKRYLLMIAIAGLLSIPASAATIYVNVGFGAGLPTVSGIVANAPSVTFGTTSFSNLSCSGAGAALCGPGYDSSSAMATFDTGMSFSNAGGEIFTFGAITYVTDGTAWLVQDFGSGFFGIHTTGTYASAGLTSTAGYLDFSFQGVTNGVGNFSASGSAIPEPGTLALLGGGLIGLGLWSRRRRQA